MKPHPKHKLLFEKVLQKELLIEAANLKLTVFDDNSMPKLKNFKVDKIQSFRQTQSGSAYTMTLTDNDIFLISKTAYNILRREIGEREI